MPYEFDLFHCFWLFLCSLCLLCRFDTQNETDWIRCFFFIWVRITKRSNESWLPIVQYNTQKSLYQNRCAEECEAFIGALIVQLYCVLCMCAAMWFFHWLFVMYPNQQKYFTIIERKHLCVILALPSFHFEVCYVYSVKLFEEKENEKSNNILNLLTHDKRRDFVL